MIKHLGYLIIAVLIAYGLQASAKTQGVTPSFALGVGHASCETWTKDHRAGGEAYEKDKAWLFGFASGYNQYEKKSHRMFLGAGKGAGQDEGSLPSGVDYECAEHPNELVEDVTINLFDELRHPRPYSAQLPGTKH